MMGSDRLMRESDEDGKRLAELEAEVRRLMTENRALRGKLVGLQEEAHQARRAELRIGEEIEALRQPCIHMPLESDLTCAWCRVRIMFESMLATWGEPVHEREALHAFDAAVQAVREGSEL